MSALKPLKFLFLLFPTILLQAQEDCLPNPYPFYCFDRNSGLISNRVNCIAQDQAGFWWFGTESGLQQFDGHTFRTYEDLPGDSVQLRIPILALYLDRSKRFWAVSNSGIFQLDTSTGRFVPSAIKAEKKPTFGFPSRMMEDSRGDLWLASSITLPGLFRLRAGSKTWEAVPLPEGTTIIARNIQEDPQTGHIWVMFLEPGKRAAFGYIDYRTEKLIPAPAALQSEVREATHFSIDGENNFWTSTTANNWTGLQVVRYGNISGTAERYNMKIPPFNPLFTDRKGRFWYFAEKRAYFGYYDQKSGTFKRFFWPIAFNNNASLNDDTLNDFFEDREGNIWIASKEGVFVFNPDKAVISPAHAIRKGQGNSKIAPALGIMQTADAKIWAGTFFNGTFQLGRDFQEIKKYLHPIPPGYVAPDAVQNLENFNAIWVFHEDRKGNIWAGGQGGVVIQFSPSGDVLWKGYFRERTIRCITSDEKGNIWLGTQGGVLGQLDPETRVFQTVLKVPQEENKPIPRLLQILPNRNDLLWLVYSDRILCFNAHTGKALPLNNRPEKGSIGMLPPSTIAHAIAWNDSSFIVVGSTIHWYDKSRRQFRPESSSNDIAALGIRSALRDGEELWLIHSSGMVRWSPKTGKTVKYDIQDGVPIQFNETENATIRLSDGRIITAWGPAGLMVFHPDSLRLSDPLPPQVRITGLTLARELARLMGGDVTAASKPGEGSAFTLWLPVLQLAADLPAVQVRSAGLPISYDDAAAWPVEPKTVKTRPTLLLVEDSPDVLYYLSVSLSPLYNLLSARNGKEGLKKVLETVPDLVISDIMMPEMDGLAFCTQLKNDVHISHIPVILLTARAGLPDKIEGLDRGADAYLVKPFDRGELLAQVRQLLEQRKRLQVYYRQTAVGDTGNQQEEHEVPKPGVDEQFLIQLRETVGARLSDPNFSAIDLERTLGMSHAQLFRKMKALLGYSANMLIRKIRIQKAQELLDKQEMSVADVAYAVGFKEPAYFSKVFKQETGVSPGEWGERSG